MAYIEWKTIKGHKYAYLKESFRDDDGRVRTRHVRYLGKLDEMGLVKADGPREGVPEGSGITGHPSPAHDGLHGAEDEMDGPRPSTDGQAGAGTGPSPFPRETDGADGGGWLDDLDRDLKDIKRRIGP